MALIIALAGCVTTVETPRGAESAAQPKPGAPLERKTVFDKRIIVDMALRHRIRIVGVRSAEGPGGFLKIQVDVQSTMDSLQQFAYRIDWYDSARQILPQASTSMDWTLLPRETSFLAATSPTPSARDFSVTFMAPGDLEPIPAR